MPRCKLESFELEDVWFAYPYLTLNIWFLSRMFSFDMMNDLMNYTLEQSKHDSPTGIEGVIDYNKVFNRHFRIVVNILNALGGRIQEFYKKSSNLPHNIVIICLVIFFNCQVICVFSLISFT